MTQVRAIATQKLRATPGARGAADGQSPPMRRSRQLVAMDIKRFFDRPGDGPAPRPTLPGDAAWRADRRHGDELFGLVSKGVRG